MLNEFITDIVNIKCGKLLDFPENEIVFSPFIVQRFISMFSPDLCYIVNETTNKKLSTLSKKELYQLWLNVVPKQRNTFAKYLKKEKNELFLTDKEKKAVDFLCVKYKISYREVIEYVKNFELNLNFL